MLPVPEARVYYEVAGSGPVLLLISGGAADADFFTPIVGFLADHYTVVRYDPRGISRSRLDGPVEDVRSRFTPTMPGGCCPRSAASPLLS